MKRYIVLPNHDGFVVGLYEDADGEYVKYEDVEQLIAERDEFAKEIQHLSLRMSDILTERDRYREALELIVENYKAMSAWDNKLIIPNLRIANEALEGEK